jgi:hypothetical protein
MSSDSASDENFGKAFDFLTPRVKSWTKELFSGFKTNEITGSQKDLFQSLAVETLLYNSLMPNDEIISVLAGIIRNISSRHRYGVMLDWGKRASTFQKFSNDDKK